MSFSNENIFLKSQGTRLSVILASNKSLAQTLKCSNNKKINSLSAPGAGKIKLTAFVTICNMKDVDTSTCHADACFLMFSREGVWKEISDTKWVNTHAKKTLVSGNAGDEKIFNQTAANLFF